MNHPFRYLLFVVLISSCQQSQNAPLPSSPSAETKELINKFAPILHGSWVQRSYTDSVRISKSPLASENALAEFVEFDIDTKQIAGDSLDFGAMNIHEGGQLTLYFKKGIFENAVPINYKSDEPNIHFQLAYKVNKTDTTLSLYKLSDQNVLLSEIKYLKTSGNRENSFQYRLNEAFFSGTYQLIDSAGHSQKVIFTNDGEVSGMEGFVKYSVQADFVAAENPIDEIGLENPAGKQTWFPFKFSSDTLAIYEPTRKDTIVDSKPTVIKYQLIKENG